MHPTHARVPADYEHTAEHQIHGHTLILRWENDPSEIGCFSNHRLDNCGAFPFPSQKGVYRRGGALGWGGDDSETSLFGSEIIRFGDVYTSQHMQRPMGGRHIGGVGSGGGSG
jgi:hypothetical protein